MYLLHDSGDGHGCVNFSCLSCVVNVAHPAKQTLEMTYYPLVIYFIGIS